MVSVYFFKLEYFCEPVCPCKQSKSMVFVIPIKNTLKNYHGIRCLAIVLAIKYEKSVKKTLFFNKLFDQQKNNFFWKLFSVKLKKNSTF